MGLPVLEKVMLSPTNFAAEIERESEPTQARQLLRKLLVGRLVWTPRVDASGVSYEYAGHVSYGRILAGLVSVKGLVPPEGFARLWSPQVRGEVHRRAA